MPFTVHSSVAQYVITDKPGVWSAEGISAAHAQAFLRVSLDTDCVILTRTPGEAALTLLAEGYDAKGFHVKGKSCDWGPWAGFICAEPRFNKSGMVGAEGNLTAHLNSLTKDFEQLRNEERKAAGKAIEGPYMCSVVAIELSDARVLWLEARGKIDKAPAEASERKGKTKLPGAPGVMVDWLLRRDASTSRWHVYYDASKLPAIVKAAETSVAAFKSALATASVAVKVPEVKGMTPVLALTNPYPAYRAQADAYKNALTGDFDLFAVWPKLEKRADFMVRVGGMGVGVSAKVDPKVDPKAIQTAIATEKKKIYAAEAADLIGSTTGNMSSGVYDVAMRLNIEMQKIRGQSQVNRVFHSDEGGRPGMAEVDEAVAFVGTGTVANAAEQTANGPMLLLKHTVVDGSGTPQENAKALAPFALSCAREGYAVFLNTGWVAAMQGVLGKEDWAELSKSVFKQEAQPAASAPSAAAPSAAAQPAKKA